MCSIVKFKGTKLYCLIQSKAKPDILTILINKIIDCDRQQKPNNKQNKAPYIIAITTVATYVIVL